MQIHKRYTLPGIGKTGAAAFIAALLLTTLSLLMGGRVEGGMLSSPFPAPEFAHTGPEQWINSDPLSISDLRGKVLLVDFWTFDCWNCYRSFPWLKAMESRLPEDSFQVIGVHTPEFEHEKVRSNVVAKTREFGLEHPVMLDNDFGYWKAMHNRFWPAFYLVDKKGMVRAVFFGETHAEDEQARRIEKTIMQLLQE